ncbi:guanylate kinase [Siculibacillus lacustris]|uniref:Guanylate kinase n=1 Tax=Siculibacillus lacustris TaxID=1549641 RepID=A0A4Q9VUE5_9HYPH|nr:guanylate kinase [Siculibacillus lacustris]TBW39775.1 guanylate kinase [Siculibacillus lacustris]
MPAAAAPLAPTRRRGLGLILASPSGAGKSTLSRQLIADEKPSITLSVSVTTRERRSSEIDGVHYRFVTRARFEAMRDHDELLEWAEVHGNFYGTPREPVEAAFAEGRDMLFDIDWQGTVQVLDKLPDDVVTIFILPPSMRELASRLHRRAEDAEEVIARRLANARIEIAEWQRFDYVVVNDDLERAYGDVRAILRAERLKRRRGTGLDGFVAGLLAEG